jgi:hypothetical protein
MDANGKLTADDVLRNLRHQIRDAHAQASSVDNLRSRVDAVIVSREFDQLPVRHKARLMEYLAGAEDATLDHRGWSRTEAAFVVGAADLADCWGRE